MVRAPEGLFFRCGDITIHAGEYVLYCSIMKYPLFKKADIVLLVVLLALGALCIFALGRGSLGGTAVVSVDGKTVRTAPLGTDTSFTVDTEYGSNTIIIEGGKVRISEADCPGGDCTRFRSIDQSGQMIICIPHHLTVTVEAEAEGQPDAVAR